MENGAKQIKLHISFSEKGDSFEKMVEKIFFDYLKENENISEGKEI